MIALLLAAQVVAAPPADRPVQLGARMVMREAVNCGLWDAQPVNRRAPQPPRIQSLGELPPAHMELTVLRLDENGCSKPVIVRRNVQGDGRFPAPRR